MSLVKTLAKVAIGVAMAKGVNNMMKKSGGRSAPSQDGGLGGLLGGLAGSMGGGGAGTGSRYDAPASRRTSSSGGGGIEDMLGGLLGGGNSRSQPGGSAGGLGGLLEQLGGTGGKGGGLQDMLGGLAGSAGTGGLLGGLAGALGQKTTKNDRSFGDVLNSAFDQNPEPEIEPTADQEAAAGLMLSAMIQAAKSDGKLDETEREKLIGQLGDSVSQEEARFVQAEMQRPVDVDGLVRQVPRGMGPQVYAMSVLGIDLDSQAEAKYLHTLAQGLGLDAKSVNHIHQQMGVPSLYS